MAKFRCGNCNYVFEPKVKDKTPSRCPYCSCAGKLFEEKSVMNDLSGLEDDSDDDF